MSDKELSKILSDLEELDMDNVVKNLKKVEVVGEMKKEIKDSIDTKEPLDVKGILERLRREIH